MSKPKRRIATVALGVGLCTLGGMCTACAQTSVPRPDSGIVSTTTAPVASVVVPIVTPDVKQGTTGLQDQLVQLVAAYRSGDRQGLARFAGERDVDLETKRVRVILEMDVSPDAHPAGSPPVETVTLADGRTVQIQQAAPIAIRADLAQAIAATGATYETAYQDQIQVMAPFASLEALARIPGVRLVRLPYPSQP